MPPGKKGHGQDFMEEVCRVGGMEDTYGEGVTIACFDRTAYP